MATDRDLTALSATLNEVTGTVPHAHTSGGRQPWIAEEGWWLQHRGLLPQMGRQRGVGAEGEVLGHVG